MPEWFINHPKKWFTPISKNAESEEFLRCVFLFGSGILLLMALERGIGSLEHFKKF